MTMIFRKQVVKEMCDLRIGLGAARKVTMLQNSAITGYGIPHPSR